MNIYPPLRFVLLNGILLTLPLLAMRFGIPALMNKKALAELDYFPPVQGLEKLALKVYFISNTFLVFSPLLAEIQPAGIIGAGGWTVYLLGIVLCAVSLIDYCQHKGLKAGGIYRISRNPLCMGYLCIYLGTALLISSWFHLVLTVIYQIAVHGLILSEERWCLESFGEEYYQYFQNTPRYFIK